MYKRREKKEYKDSLLNNNPQIKFVKKKYFYKDKIFMSILFLIFIAFISLLLSFIISKFKYEGRNEKIENINIEYSNVVANIKESIVTIGSTKEALNNNEYSGGNVTGIVIQESGRILANYSFIKDFEEIYVKLSFLDSEPIEGEIIFLDENIDIAIIQVKVEKKLTPVKIANVNELVANKKIILINNSITDKNTDNLLPGIITTVNNKINIKNKVYDLFTIDTYLNKLDTTGIVINLNGEVLGIISKKVNSEINKEGTYYVIDITSLEKIVDDLKEIKNILGITEGEFVRINDETWQIGLYVTTSLKSDDLSPTDIILEIEGKSAINIIETLEMLKNKESGETITCKVIRAGNVIEINVKLNNLNK